MSETQRRDPSVRDSLKFISLIDSPRTHNHPVTTVPTPGAGRPTRLESAPTGSSAPPPPTHTHKSPAAGQPGSAVGRVRCRAGPRPASLSPPAAPGSVPTTVARRGPAPPPPPWRRRPRGAAAAARRSTAAGTGRIRRAVRRSPAVRPTAPAGARAARPAAPPAATRRPAARAGWLLPGSVSNSSPGRGLYPLFSPVVAGATEPGTVSCCGPCSGRASPSPAAACADRGRDYASDRDKVRDSIRTESGRAQQKMGPGTILLIRFDQFPNCFDHT